MNTYQISCKCSALLRVSDADAGSRLQCSNCRTIIEIPHLSELRATSVENIVSQGSQSLELPQIHFEVLAEPPGGQDSRSATTSTDYLKITGWKSFGFKNPLAIATMYVCVFLFLRFSLILFIGDILTALGVYSGAKEAVRPLARIDNVCYIIDSAAFLWLIRIILHNAYSAYVGMMARNSFRFKNLVVIVLTFLAFYLYLKFCMANLIIDFNQIAGSGEVIDSFFESLKYLFGITDLAALLWLSLTVVRAINSKRYCPDLQRSSLLARSMKIVGCLILMGFVFGATLLVSTAPCAESSSDSTCEVAPVSDFPHHSKDLGWTRIP